MSRASLTRTSSNDATPYITSQLRPQIHRNTRIRTTREHTSTTSLDTRDAITPTPLSAQLTTRQAFTWRKIHGCTIISALQDLARRAKNDKKAGTNFCFIPSASIALPVAIAHKNFLEYFTFPPLLPRNSTGLSACILGTTSLSSFLGVNWGSINWGIRRERRMEPEF
jgi:hypothetical protein